MSIKVSDAQNLPLNVLLVRKNFNLLINKSAEAILQVGNKCCKTGIRKVIILSLIFFSTKLMGQVSSFQIDCGIPIDVTYVTHPDKTNSLYFFWNHNELIDLSESEINILKNQQLTRTLANEIFKRFSGVISSEQDILNFAVMNETNKINLTLRDSIKKEQIIDMSNLSVMKIIYSDLKSKNSLRASTLCSQSEFANKLNNGIENFKTRVLTSQTKAFVLDDPEIIQLKNSEGIPDRMIFTQNDDTSFYYNSDIRNPVAFTNFIVRNPRTNGKDELIKPSNFSSYHYIRPGSIVNVVFEKLIYKKLNNSKISIQAYLKRKDESVVPITVSGFSDVKIISNQTEFEKNIQSLQDNSTATNTVNGSAKTLSYNYSVKSSNMTPIQAEINTSMANPRPEDKLIVTVANVSDGGVSFTMTFEFQDYGWTIEPIGGFSWILPIDQGTHNFSPAGSSGVSFYYKLNKGAKFWSNFFNPSFGPELNVLQDENQNTNVALGLSASLFLRTIKVGYGWFLVGQNGRPYVSLGVNFVEGYKTIATVLKRANE